MVVQWVECWSTTYEALGSIPHIAQIWYSGAGLFSLHSGGLSRSRSSEGQGHPTVDSEFEANLGYMGQYLKKTKIRNSEILLALNSK